MSISSPDRALAEFEVQLPFFIKECPKSIPDVPFGAHPDFHSPSPPPEIHSQPSHIYFHPFFLIFFTIYTKLPTIYATSSANPETGNISPDKEQ